MRLQTASIYILRLYLVLSFVDGDGSGDVDNIFSREPVDRIKNGDLQKFGSELGSLVVNLQGSEHGIVQDSTSTEGSTPTEKLFIDIIGFSSYGFRKSIRPVVEQIVNCHEHICTAFIESSRLSDLTNLDTVKFVRPVVSLVNRAAVISEGDSAMLADIARIQHKVNGTGAVIGVLSNSYNCLKGADQDVKSGDLPENVIIAKDLTAEECTSLKGDDEGRAMIQLIYDVAPGATVVFHTCARGSIDMATAMLTLVVDYRVDIIVDDVSYLDQPFYQDGRLAQVVDNLVTYYGVAYFTSAGNDNFKVWDSSLGFVDSGVKSTTGATLHSFGTGPNGQPITTIKVLIQNGATTRINLYWDEPFWSVSGQKGCTSDLDLFAVLTSGEIVPVAVTNNMGGDAIESLSITPNITGLGVSTITIRLSIGLVRGPAPTMMKLYCPLCADKAFPDFEHSYPASFGIANSVGAAAIAASDALDERPKVEAYSSSGGVPIVFNKYGKRNPEPEIRMQPLFTGPDGAVTTFHNKYKADLWRFYGTSAAASHVAAVAALMKEVNDNLVASDIFDILRWTAYDNIGQPGFDFRSGYGMINAEDALDVAATGSTAPSPGPTSAPSYSPSSHPTAMPSVAPSASPSAMPTSRPSSKPSASPSEAPTCAPSVAPSNRPSERPSVAPSDIPSSMPSDFPTAVPFPDERLINKCYREVVNECGCKKLFVLCQEKVVNSCIFSFNGEIAQEEAMKVTKLYNKYRRRCNKKRKKG